MPIFIYNLIKILIFIHIQISNQNFLYSIYYVLQNKIHIYVYLFMIDFIQIHLYLHINHNPLDLLFFIKIKISQILLYLLNDIFLLIYLLFFLLI